MIRWKQLEIAQRNVFIFEEISKTAKAHGENDKSDESLLLLSCSWNGGGHMLSLRFYSLHEYVIPACLCIVLVVGHDYNPYLQCMRGH